jgi:hypothetical protein
MYVDVIRPQRPAVTFLSVFRTVIAMALCVIFAACTPIQLVADHSPDSEKAIMDASASIFALYDRMIDQKLKDGPGTNLPYAAYAEGWGQAESQLRLVVMRESSRPLNAESTRIAESILRLCHKFRESHRSSNDYKLAKLRIDLNHLSRNLSAALAAEKGKLLAKPDEPPADGS